MASIFTRIIQGEIPCHKIYEDDRVFSFLDINPVSKGHTLLIPKLEVDYIYDLEDDLLKHLFATSKRISQAIEEVVTCERIAVAVVGLEVPHAHIHLIPINEISDFSFTNPKLSFTQEEFSRMAEQISSRIRG